MLDVKELTGWRHNKFLFSDIYFTLKKGEILLLEGQNGTGKTSLLRMLAGLCDSYLGKIYWENQPIYKDIKQYQRHVIYLNDSYPFISSQSVVENLSFWTRLYGARPLARLKDQCLDALRLCQLEEMANEKAGYLSQGQRQRLNFCRLILANKALMLLDEPHTSLDHNGQVLLKQLLTFFRDNGRMVVIASHQPLSLEGMKNIRLP